MAKTQEPETDVENFHEDIKKRHSCLRSCLIVFAGITLVLALTAVVVMARVGLPVPLLSKLFYKDPHPTNSVTVTDNLLDGLAQKLIKVDEEKGKETELTLSQEELTALARQKNPDVTVSITETGIEYFGPIEIQGQKLIVTASVVPRASDGHLRLTVQTVKLGQFGVPKILLDLASSQIQSLVIDTNALVKQLEIREIVLKNGSVTIRGKIPPNFSESL